MRKLIPLFLLMMACTPSKPCPESAASAAAPCPQDATAPPVADAAPAPADATPSPADVAPPTPPQPNDACAAGEAKLLALGCKDTRGRLIGGPDLHGVGWAVQCRTDAEAGVDLHPICIAAATSCQAVMQCK